MWRGQLFAWLEFHLLRALRELVPGTHRQAIVAAIDAIAHHAPKFTRNGPFVFDGEIGNAAPCIQAIRDGKSFGGADVEALTAIAAMIALAFVWRQFQGGEDRAEEEPGPKFPAD